MDHWCYNSYPKRQFHLNLFSVKMQTWKTQKISNSQLKKYFLLNPPACRLLRLSP